MTAKNRQPIFARQSNKRFFRGIQQRRSIRKRSLRQHPFHPFFRAAAIVQSGRCLLPRQMIQPRNPRHPVRSLRRAPKHPKSRNPAIRKNIQPHMRRRAHFLQLPPKNLYTVRLQRHARQQLPPIRRAQPRNFRARPLRLTNLDRTTIRKISLKMRRVHFHVLNRTRHSQFHNRPIMSRPPPPLRFPPVAHTLAAPRHQHIKRLAVKLIAGHNHPPAIFHRRQIQFALGDSPRARHHYTVQPQTRHSSIRINLETHVRKTPRMRHHRRIYRIALQSCLRQDLLPMRRRSSQPFLFVPVGRGLTQSASFQRKTRRIISREKTRVHDRSAQNSRQSQSHDAPIASRSPPPPGLPSVHPLSPVVIFPHNKDRLLGLQQIFLRSEKFVIGQHHAAAQPLRRQIRELREPTHAAPRCSTCPTGPAENSPRSNSFRPRKNVASTRPASSRPA